jgi:oxygen-independent coproporphyrinogen-3 oxidase
MASNQAHIGPNNKAYTDLGRSVVESEASLRRLIEIVLSETSLQRVRDRLGGSHTVVTYPPLDALSPTDENSPEPFDIVPPQGAIHYYVHTPTCESICEFCHYTTTVYRDGQSEIDDYLAALHGEAERRRAQTAGADVASYYFGGGTPTALNVNQLSRLLEVSHLGATSSTPELCVETSPITMTASDGRAKLQLLIDAGVTRLSMGVQTFDRELLPSLRRHDLETLLTALDMLKATGRALNIDLIQDLAGQDRESLQNDLRFVERYRPDQVTWYILRLHAPSIMAKRAKAHGIQAIGDVESALRRSLVISGMRQLGYQQGPGGRFMLGRGADMYKAVRGGVDSHLLGLGVSSYSHGWGWFFRNVTHQNARVAIRTYTDRIRNGRSPVAWASAISKEERLAGQLCQLCREEIPAELLIDDSAAATDAREILASLEAAGLFRRGTSKEWVLTHLGRLFEEEIASLFYSRTTRRRLERRDAYWLSGDSGHRETQRGLQIHRSV